MAMLNINEDAPQKVLKSVFSAYDLDNNGTLDAKEFQTLLSALGIDKKNAQEACKLLADANNDGVVSKKEFYDWIKKDKIQSVMQSSEKFNFLVGVTEIFKSFDVNGDNEITWKEFKKYMVEGEGKTKKEAIAFWKEIDINGDGKISFKEFWNHTKDWDGQYE